MRIHDNPVPLPNQEPPCIKRWEVEQLLIRLYELTDVFGILPTGFGKFLCYASLPIIYDKIHQKELSIVIIVTLLISIMKDQVWCLLVILKHFCIDTFYYYYIHTLHKLKNSCCRLQVSQTEI